MSRQEPPLRAESEYLKHIFVTLSLSDPHRIFCLPTKLFNVSIPLFPRCGHHTYMSTKSLKADITGDQAGQDEGEAVGSGMEGGRWTFTAMMVHMVVNVTRIEGHCGIFNHVRMMEKHSSNVWCLQYFRSSFSVLFWDPQVRRKS